MINREEGKNITKIVYSVQEVFGVQINQRMTRNKKTLKKMIIMNQKRNHVAVEQREIEEVQEQKEDTKNNSIIINVILDMITRFIINNF